MLGQQKSPNLSVKALCSCCLPSRVGQVLRPKRSEGSPLAGSWRRNSPVDCFRHNCDGYSTSSTLKCGASFIFALPIFPGRPSIILPFKKCPVDTFRQKKAPTFRSGLVFALPIFPGSHPPSIVGVHELNFCVRDGNRWTLMTINTNYSRYIP